MFINFNGNYLPADAPIVTADNRGLRYGDGLFETIKVINGHVLLAPLHWQRLFRGLSVLQFTIPSHFTPEYLQEILLTLSKKNNVAEAARLRLMVFRGNGSLLEKNNGEFNFIVQATTLAASYTSFNSQGISVGLYEEVIKSCDILANLKSNNYLPYIMASQYALKHQLGDCIVLNNNGRVCDTTIANIFGVNGNTIFTPALSEGCVAGVMRQYLLDKLREDNYDVVEKAVVIEDLENADEVFLTNALYGIRSVKNFRHCNYKNEFTSNLYKNYIALKNP